MPSLCEVIFMNFSVCVCLGAVLFAARNAKKSSGIGLVRNRDVAFLGSGIVGSRLG